MKNNARLVHADEEDAHLPNGLRWDVPGSFRDANGT